MNKAIKITLMIFIILLIILSWFLFDPLAFLPHSRLQIVLPFDSQYDSSTGMIPMGETIFHPKPQVPHGHPGIDFQWNTSVPIIASADGIITSIQHGSSNGIDVEIRNGVYALRYKEMDEKTLSSNIKILHFVKKGEFIGNPDATIGGDGKKHYQLHWEFASNSVIKDRFCPLTYFTNDSLMRINSIWDNVSPQNNQNMKLQFPYICSGDYYNKTE